MSEPKASHSASPPKSATTSTVPGTAQTYPSNNNVHGRLGKAPKSAQKTGPAASPPGPKDTFREIVETVVFVVVLVLLLKSFVAEAFVIPTGSMAETLYGYQKIVTCPKCHEVFPVNCSCEVDPQQAPNTDVVGCTCPNCRYEINFEREGMKPPWHTGDRVLVAKSVYDLKLLPGDKPKRRDVVVFKYPREPQRAFTPMNYIKRLIGLPGETVAIYYGKIYVYDGLQYDDSNVDPLNLWELRYTHQDDSQALDLFHKGKFRMVRKSPSEMLAVRRKVYDNDHQAIDLIGKVPPRWAANGTSWQPDKPDEPKRFEHSAQDDKEVAWLRYHHLIPDAGPDRTTYHPELITDFMGYNTWRPARGPHGTPPQNWVGDLLLEADVDVQQAQGELIFELSKGVDQFRARWDLATGRCALSRVSNDQEALLEEAETGLKKAGHYRLRLANIDERLTVWVDSSLPFGEGVVYEPPLRRGPTVENDLQPAGIGVKGAGVTVSHLKLWRDTYYTVHIDTQQADAPNVRFDNPEDWKNALSDLPVSTMYVQPGHYLCLGDNSPESSDGRSWGLVPERLLLGRAMVIYYPFWPISPRAGLIR
jgi:signal peptidase I